jgi:hypothetical protein
VIEDVRIVYALYPYIVYVVLGNEEFEAIMRSNFSHRMLTVELVKREALPCVVTVDTHGLTPVALAKEVCIYLEGCMPSNSL